MHDGNLEEAGLLARGGRLLLLLSRRLVDEEEDEERDDGKCGAADEEGHAHREELGERPAEEGPENAARGHSALHDAHGKADALARHGARHDCEAGGPEARGEALEAAHGQKLPLVLHDAAQRIGDGEEDCGAKRHELARALVGHGAPDRGHDA